jgi:hypothetical protein
VGEKSSNLVDVCGETTRRKHSARVKWALQATASAANAAFTISKEARAVATNLPGRSGFRRQSHMMLPHFHG